MSELLTEVLAVKSIKDVASSLGLCVGTVRRWQELKSVPNQYTFDLLKLLSRPIDYSAYTEKEKDQFFTPPDIARRCWETFLRVTQLSPEEIRVIEPSAGDGSFLACLPAGTLGLDIEPRAEGILKQDYLTWIPPPSELPYAVVGNPPFGLRGHLALQFLNHSYSFAEYVAFILPQLFESDGKGSPRKRVVGYNLIHSEPLTTEFHTPNATSVAVNCVFQIWSKSTVNEEYALRVVDDGTLKVYSMSDGGTVATTRNKAKIGQCHLYLPSTCFNPAAMRAYDSFEELPNRKGYGIVFQRDTEALREKAKRIDWASASFLSTNSALNLRTSIIVRQFAE